MAFQNQQSYHYAGGDFKFPTPQVSDPLSGPVDKTLATVDDTGNVKNNTVVTATSNSSSSEDIEGELARHHSKRMSMPNLPLSGIRASSGDSGMNSYFPPTHEDERLINNEFSDVPLRPSPVQQRRMSFDALRESNRSPSINLRSPSPLRTSTNSSDVASSKILQEHSINKSSPSSPASPSDNLKQTQQIRRQNSNRSKRDSPGWLWRRRSSQSSLNVTRSHRSETPGSTEISPRFRPSSLSPSPSFMVLNKPSPVSTPGLAASPGSPRDRTPSPSAILRASPLSQLPTPNGDMSPSSLRPPPFVTPRRSLSASVLQLGRKVASFGNSVSINAHQNAMSSSWSAAAAAASRPSSSQTSVAPSPRTSLDVISRVQQAQPSSSGARSPVNHVKSNDVLTAEVPWSFKVHRVYESIPNPTTSSSMPTGMERPVNEHSQVNIAAQEHVTVQTQTETTAKDLSGSAGETSFPFVSMTENALVNQTNVRASPAPKVIRHLSPLARPALRRNAKSDDASDRGGMSASSRLINAAEEGDGRGMFSSSAPSPSSVRQSSSGYLSPGRQPSPNPSRDLTLIPEIDENQSPVRSSDWHASLRGRPKGSRRMSAADLFSSNGSPQKADSTRKVFPIDTRYQEITQRDHNSFEASISTKISAIRGLDRNEEGLDFSKRPIPVPPHSDLKTLSSDGRTYSATPVEEHGISPVIRSRAVSQSSLLSRSRPETPACSTSLQAMSPMTDSRTSDNLPAHAGATGTPFEVVPQRRPHRHTHSLPSVPLHDPTQEVTGLGAPESSVLAASHARFAKVLLAAAAAPTTVGAQLTSDITDHKVRDTLPATSGGAVLDEQRKGHLRQLLLQSKDLGSAVVEDDSSSSSDEAGDLIAHQARSHGDARLPRLSYGTIGSADSRWSRELGPDYTSPCAPSAISNATYADESTRTSGFSRQTSSSMSNAQGPTTAVDVFLAQHPSQPIDGMPDGSIISGWSRKEASDDSTISCTTRQASDGDSVSVW